MPNLNKQILDLPANNGGVSLDGSELVEIQKGSGVGSSQKLTLTLLASKVKEFIASAFATAAQGTKADNAVQTVQAGSNITVDNTDPNNPKITGLGAIASVVAGTNVTIDNTDPRNPKINGSGGIIKSLVAGSNVTIDNTDPANPIISATGGGGGGGSSGATLIGSATVSGVAATSLTVTGVNLSASKQYTLRLKVKNALASPRVINLVVNGDNTAANYSRRVAFIGSGGLVAGGGASSNALSGLDASDYMTAVGTLDRDGAGNARLLLEGSRASGNNTATYFTTVIWASNAPITSIGIIADAAGTLDIGTTIEIYEVLTATSTSNAQTALAAEIMADSPKVYYKCDETSGTTLADSSGNGKGLTTKGTNVLGLCELVEGGGSIYSASSGTSANGASRADTGGIAVPASYDWTICFIFNNITSGTNVTMFPFSLTGAGETEAANTQFQPVITTNTYGLNVALAWESSAGVNTSIGAPTVPESGPFICHIRKTTATKTIDFFVNGRCIYTTTYTTEPTGGTTASLFINSGESASIACNFCTTSNAAFFPSALPNARIKAHAKAAGFWR